MAQQSRRFLSPGEARMESTSPRRPPRKDLNRQKYLFRVIFPAIRGQSCPICLKALDDHRRAAVLAVCLHAYCIDCICKWSDVKRRCPLCNGWFHSWFTKINVSSRTFITEKLPPPDEGQKVISQANLGSSGHWQRTIQRSRRELNTDNRRSRPLPWRRTFGRPGSVPSHVIAGRKLRWRVSVYNRDLRAVPLSPRNRPMQNTSSDNCITEQIRQRIEPWIQRELQAILEDPDPSVVVHVASSLYIASLGKPDVGLGHLPVTDNFLAPLQPFLRNWSDKFWHELRYII
uniref:RING-type E3 ubiquitin transferase n=1 Tax=Rhizophora mucronata TaxID=61149 RepID=A0A2P2M2K0_RHIMU